jgi:hypothetical protein
VVIVSDDPAKAIDMANLCIRVGVSDLDMFTPSTGNWVTVVLGAKVGSRVQKGVPAWE